MSTKKEMKLMWTTIRKLNETVEFHNHTLVELLKAVKKLSNLMGRLNSALIPSQN